MIRRPNKTDIKSNINRTVLSINLFFCTNSAIFVNCCSHAFTELIAEKPRCSSLNKKTELLQTSAKSFYDFFHFALQDAFRRTVYAGQRLECKVSLVFERKQLSFLIVQTRKKAPHIKLLRRKQRTLTRFQKPRVCRHLESALVEIVYRKIARNGKYPAEAVGKIFYGTAV